eukprot:CAMPEP_0176042106 /NCGR_PEP_ID=MMETSP0120_2-20121206/20892_1 /TAXON_ID=160619 /ORGANISM="Kryptoperidinium foliaceum, Strain CCMP 1326" /LENGTH=105 /DNA_ID=CAMNT_0017375517 /DNA_START=342 /DNA_END=662 /DNA_ORIENTATION=-
MALDGLNVGLKAAHHQAYRDNVAAPRIASQLCDALNQLLQVDRPASIYIKRIKQIELLLVRNVQVPQNVLELVQPAQVIEELRSQLDAQQTVHILGTAARSEKVR